MRDVDESIKAWDAVLQAGHTPVREIKQLPFPPSSKADRDTVIRTAEILLNGAELHLLQPIGGANPWRDHLEKHGEGSLQHLAFRTTDVKGTVGALLAMGGTLILGSDVSSAHIEMPQLPFTIELLPRR